MNVYQEMQAKQIADLAERVLELENQVRVLDAMIVRLMKFNKPVNPTPANAKDFPADF